MNLLPHQVKFAKGYPDKGLIAHEAGTGKSVCASVWLHDGRDADALVICPKRIIEKWTDTLRAWQTKATVVSKEQFKKMPPKQWSAIVVDEADEFASPLFTKQRSQLSTALYSLVKTYPDVPILLTTATPIRSNPWNLHTLLCFLGIYIDKNVWRDKFFTLEKKPYLTRMAYFPKKDWRSEIRPYLEKFADIVLLRDCVGYLPPVTEEVIKIKEAKFPGYTELTASGQFYERHRFEQKEKAEYILDIAKGYRKVLIVAYYVEQIKELEKQLSKNRQTFVVHGSSPDQENTLKEANTCDECFLIVQASLGAGFDADTFSAVIYASMSFKVRDYVQMKARIRRIHNLHPVHYYYLIAGRADKNVKETVEKGFEFIPSEWTA